MMKIGRACANRSLPGILKNEGKLRWISEVSGKRFAALWGNGDYGRLGHGSLESHWTPKPLLPSVFDNRSLRQIACGGAHTLFLTENGRVYASGLNDYGQIGVPDDRGYITEPLVVDGLPKEILEVSAGYHHSAAITVDGELYMWGKNANGQLGLGKQAATILPVPTKVECLNGVKLRFISLGFEHSVAVTDKGETLSWGGGGSGRLGHGHQSGILGLLKSNSEYTPRLIQALEGVKVKNAAAGMLHSVCISENGSVHIFGETANKKWGLSSEASNKLVPHMVDELPYSEKVACGGYHTCVITGGGELYVWGTNENGCLGIGCTDVSDSPERVEGPFLRHSVSEISCGWKHTAAISGGNVYTWGWGGSHGTFSVDGHSSGGQLGRGNDVDYIEPTLVNFDKQVKALQISCGFNHTGAILEYL